MATDRLRRRVRDVDADELADLTESFCVVGTPLPDLNGWKKDQNELKPIWQQEARDEQGRRRFHGAFTGGFSAGYFNTVGSKEGWTPSSFRSSRADKQAGKQSQQAIGNRPEDFMDEEDLQDWKAAQQVSTSSTFGESKHDDSQLAGLRQSGGASTSLADTVFAEVGSSNNDGLGFKLLRKMGWKDGQGLGPRVDAKKRARLLSMVSSSNDASLATSSKVTLEDLKHLYAPPPTPVLSYASNQGSRRGLGAEEKPNLYQTLSSGQKLAPTVAAAAEDTSEDVWPDGRPLPPGFRLASQSLPPEPVFPRDPIPADWQPDPSRVWKRYASHSDPIHTDAKKDNTTPAARGQLLGEAKIPGPPPSIAAFLSAKAREKLAADKSLSLPAGAAPESVYVPRLDVATAKQALQGFAPFGTDAAKQERYRDYLKGQVEPASERAKRLPVPAELTADQFSNELREFAKSAAIFRPMSSAIASRFTTASASVMEHETKATSATPGLRHPEPKAASSSAAAEQVTGGSSSAPPEKELTIAQKAAQMGNFGHLTRQVETWAPERLLCKRFGVPEPAVSRKRRAEESDSGPSQSTAVRPDVDEEPDAFYGSTKSTKSKSSVFKVDQHWERNKEQLKALAAGPTPLSLDAQAATHSVLRTPATVAEEEAYNEVGLGDDERQGRDTLTYVKPSLDVYKAIFESDEEATDSEGAVSKSSAKAQPKMQDPASGSSLVFQARTKRKDAEGSFKVSSAVQGDKKRKKEKSKGAKSLLTFDFEDGEEAQEASAPVAPKSKGKARTRASDLF